MLLTEWPDSKIIVSMSTNTCQKEWEHWIIMASNNSYPDTCDLEIEIKNPDPEMTLQGHFSYYFPVW